MFPFSPPKLTPYTVAKSPMSPGKNSRSQIVDSLWAVVLSADEVLVVVKPALNVGDELIVPLIGAGPFEADGQKLPVCCRQLNWVTTSGSTGVPSGLLTTSKKASLAIDPPRGSCRDGHMIQGKPWDPLTLRRCSVANPFPSNTSNSLGVWMMGV